MASNELAATLRFLTDAGHLLATTVPEASAYLLSRRNDLMFEHEVPLSDKQRQHVCSCCGHIMLPGQGSDLEVKPEKKTDRTRRSARLPTAKRAQSIRRQPRLSGPTKSITCGLCGRQTEVKLPAPAPISRRDPTSQRHHSAPTPREGAASSASSVSQETPAQRSSANASSKKRAKARKAGLQALLDQSSARGSRPGLGLSLADFLEKK